MREVFSLNPEWKYHLGDIELHNFSAIHESRFKAPEWMKAGNHGIAKPAYKDDHWADIDLPHDFVIEQPFSPDANQVHGSLPTDVAWYRKVFALPEGDIGKRIFLEFDGIYRDCEIWLNGHFIKRHLSGYTSFSVDVTEVCEFGGLNALAVRVDARNFELWSYEGGGIYRDVRLVKTHPLHVTYCGSFARADVPHCEQPEAASFHLEHTLRNDLRDIAGATVLSRVLDPSGKEVERMESECSLPALSNQSILQQCQIANPKLWSPDAPHLYSVETQIILDNKVVDVYETTFGIRSIVFDAKTGVSLNGQKIKLKGLCNHQDHAGVGIAIPDRLQEWRVEQMKLMGCNAMRTAHNPPTPALLSICDRLGILVMDEVRMPGATPELMGQMESLILRDRNHPSVILWSLGNEEMLIQETPIGARMLQRMQDRVHQMDPTRLCTYSANCDFNEIADNFDSNGFRVDVFGANYTSRRGEDGKLYCEAERYDEFHAKYPDWPLLGGETGGSTATRGLYGREYYEGEPHHPDTGDLGIDNYVDLNPARDGDATAYNETMTPWGRSAEDTWRDCAEREFLGGTFLWTGFDYRGETYPFSWPSVVTRYGLMDLCGFPKDVFYYYQSWWTNEPVLHLFPHWNWSGEEGVLKDVWCYSNCAEVELKLNGVSLGRKVMPTNGKLAWEVAYEPGELEACGFDAEGNELQQKVITTAKDAFALRLTADRSVLSADGCDVAMIRCEVVDQDGRFVANAGNLIEFDITEGAKILGVGNGDPNSHEPDKAFERLAFNGLVQVLVQAGRSAGSVVLRAKAKGLEGAELSLTLTENSDSLPELFAASVADGSSGKHVNSIDGAL
ncbi:MAG: beta-galactosidase GalA [Coraliomargaritaceae bacterium]